MMMKPDCEACGCKGGSVAEVTVPAIGTYSACGPCMDAGVRPQCAKGCGRQSEYKDERGLWCWTCFELEREARRVTAAVRQAELVQQADAALEARIAAAVHDVLAKKGLL